ncbi:zinc finger protein 583-like [Hyposmocoma kahamanoa]|uniref:zinc finger protein 583-like n=1 Tax=Hyposmocoma kahamanoa TaxID=1477025 RepID=UPI000E6D9C69|nr:zinc finger protein 583-like [Hyposmocoma kahamanoa]
MVFDDSDSDAENVLNAIEITMILRAPNFIGHNYFDFGGFKIEVELDRISEDGGLSQDGVETTSLAKENNIQPIRSIKKEKRQTYLDLVEGKYDPKKPVKCKVCKKTVSKWACFINHAKKHLGFKYICEYCGKSFISLNQLKRHCRSYHGMARDIKCRHCSYLALDNAQLMVHERRMHTGERPYICDVCAAAYFSRKCLIQHIECHRTVASIQCDKCSLLFKSQRHLSKHKYGAHGEKRRARRRLQRAQLKNQHVD